MLLKTKEQRASAVGERVNSEFVIASLHHKAIPP